MERRTQHKHETARRFSDSTFPNRQLEITWYQNVPFVRVSETVTRQNNSWQLEPIENLTKRNLPDHYSNQYQGNVSPNNMTIASKRSDKPAAPVFEKDALGSYVYNQKKPTADQLPHPSKLRKRAKSDHKVEPRCITDVTRHIQQLKNKQLICDSLLDKVHNKQHNTDVSRRKYKTEPSPAFISGIKNETNSALVHSTNLPYRNTDSMDESTNSEAKLVGKGKTKREPFLDNFTFVETYIKDAVKPLPDGAQPVTTQYRTNMPISEKLLPGHDGSLTLRPTNTTALLDDSWQQSFLSKSEDEHIRTQTRFDQEDYVINAGQLQDNGTNTISDESGILWDLPLMCSTPKTDIYPSRHFSSYNTLQQVKETPQSSFMAPIRPSNNLTTYADPPRTTSSYESTWTLKTADFASQDLLAKNQTTWCSPPDRTHLCHCSSEQEVMNIYSPVMSNEVCHSVDSDNYCWHNPYEAGHCDGKNNLSMSQMENIKLDFWERHGGDILEE